MIDNSHKIMIWACMLTVMLTVPTGAVIFSGDNYVPEPSASVIVEQLDTIVLQPNATEGKDTYIWGSAGNTDNNFGESSSIFAGSWSTLANIHSLIQFPISSNPKTVQSATLSLYVTNTNGAMFNCSVQSLNSTWEEGTTSNDMAANWTHRTTTAPWTTPGGDYAATPIAYMWGTQMDIWMDFDVTSIVNDWNTGATVNNGFILRGNNVLGANDLIYFASSDEANPIIRPKLTLTYSAEIEPPVPAQSFQEDDPARTISLVGKAGGTVEHISGIRTSGNSIPFWGATANQMHVQYIYTPEQVGAEGIISSLEFNRTTPTDTGLFNNFQVKFAHTTLDILTDTYNNNYQGTLLEVFPTQNLFVNSSNDDRWFRLNLNDDFTYDSEYNLLIDIVWNGDSGDSISMAAETITDRRVFDMAGGVTGGVDNSIPIIRFGVDVVNNAVIEDGVANNGMLFNNALTYGKMQILYNATELGNESGIVDSIGLFHSVAGVSSYPNLTISVAHTDDDSLSTTFGDNYLGSLTDVYFSDNVSFDETGWVEFDIDDTFTYDGVRNLLVQVEWNGTMFGLDSYMRRQNTVAGNGWLYTSTPGALTGSTSGNIYCVNLKFCESDNLTWSASSSNTNLFTATISGGQNLVITPIADANGVGTAYLTLTNSDGGQVTQNIPVTINAVNDAPILSGPGTITCTEDIETLVDMTPYMTDIDSPVEYMTYSTNSAYASVNGSIITFLYPEGIYDENVIITVTDNYGLSDTHIAYVTIVPVNDIPELASFVDTLTCDAELDEVYTVHPEDEETVTGNLTISTNSDYATVNNHVITFNYPKGIGSESVTITLVDEDIYGEQNTHNYDLAVTINDHPDIISHSPNGTDVAVTTTIQATFDMPMNETLVENAFTLSNGTDGVSGNFSWNTAHTAMTFTPNDALGNGLYLVTIGNTASSETGMSMYNTYSWNFTAALGTYDGDGDGIPDQYEIDNGLDPEVNDANSDLDSDGMPNIWEYEYGLDPGVDDGALDSDGDGVSNLDEYLEGNDPNNPDDAPSEFPWMLIIIILVIIVALVLVLLLMKNKKDEPEYKNEEYQGQEGQEFQEQEPVFEEQMVEEEINPSPDEMPPPPPPQE
ncbi:MAG: DNRLRE domain-containing protein [Thermoplasmata archaeon]|nr:DNRLRE domain-containing protein [Thermoplasmata archaeon]